jgi:hypothetical protein
MNTVKTKAFESTRLVVDLESTESTLRIVYEGHLAGNRTELEEIVDQATGRGKEESVPQGCLV